MRLIVTVLACLTAGGISQAFADPPTAPATPPPAAVPASAATPAAATTAPATPPAAASTPAPAAATTAQPAAAPPSSAAADEAQKEKQLRAQGYSPRMRDGQKYFCKREAPVGSRFESKLTCLTPEEADRVATDARANIEHMQRSMGCMGTARGSTCGN
jgi:hypothetical protein